MVAIDRFVRERLVTAERELAKAISHLRDARHSDFAARRDGDVHSAMLAVSWALEEIQTALDQTVPVAA